MSKGQYTKQIIKKCSDNGIKIDTSDSHLMFFLDGYTTLPQMKKLDDGSIMFKYSDGWEHKDITFGKDGKYSYSWGHGVI